MHCRSGEQTLGRKAGDVAEWGTLPNRHKSLGSTTTRPFLQKTKTRRRRYGEDESDPMTRAESTEASIDTQDTSWECSPPCHKCTTRRHEILGCLLIVFLKHHYVGILICETRIAP